MALSFPIQEGVMFKAQKVVIYGPEGIGKSTFAAKFPEPLFIDTEGSTNHLKVKRLPRPTSWAMLKQMVSEVVASPGICRTLVIDTMDWAERLCEAHVCAEGKQHSIDGFGYGKGYVLVKEEFGRLLDRLSDLIEQGVNVVLTAHSILRKFERPDESGAYDRYELKLGNKAGSQISALVKEWSDMLLFANYKETVVESADTKKKKAYGGKRVLYTQHHPAWDAKNRCDFPPELPFEYDAIDYVIEAARPLEVSNDTPPAVSKEEIPAKAETEKPATPAKTKKAVAKPKEAPPVSEEKAPEPFSEDGIPPKLADLMKANNVTPEEIRSAVASRGYFPKDTPIANYPEDFVEGCLVAAWPQVFQIIANERVPF